MRRVESSHVSFRSRGLTLVEVLAALVILSLLLAAALSVQGKTSRQWRRAQNTEQLLAAAEALLATWYVPGSDGPPLSEEGELQLDGATFSWRITPITPIDAVPMRTIVVRFEVLDERERVLLSVELPTRKPQPDEKATEGDTE